MANKKSNFNKQIEDAINLIESIEKMEIEKKERSIFDVPPPYSSGKTPEPQRWNDQGIQHKQL